MFRSMVSPRALSQVSIAAWWPEEGYVAASRFDELLSRVALLADDGTRGDILKYVGRSDIPGSPAERYQTIVNSLGGEPLDPEILRDRLNDLNVALSEIEARVKNAETAYGTLPASAEAGGTSDGGKMGACFAGGVALLSFVILPIILD